MSSYNATVGGLPAGLSFDASSGVISGTPEESGSFQIDISVTDASGTGTATLIMDIALDDPVATVSAAPSSIVAADNQTAKFRFRLSHAVPRDTAIYYYVRGDLAPFYNESIFNDSVLIPAGQTEATLKLVPSAADFGEPAGAIHKMKIVLSPYSLGTYSVGTPGSARVKVVEP